MSSKIERDLAAMEMRAVRVEQQLEEKEKELQAAERLILKIADRLEYGIVEELPTCSRQIFRLLQAAGYMTVVNPDREVRIVENLRWEGRTE